ncbi:Sulfotransferase family protein [Pustulibacterium marinum]|uniref:Sulfotransferase family protein n=1 Tax=Pustulibacterium marinum TaxID=1224947 RepID=A0A1I7HMC3_9FLAO|nr:sulfotransferase family 2 domain-containing protein [Pustulibacterium marinum]SFU61865.1 Sulfotransferase family protein [Pustulibacterium marinum]
MISHEHKCIFIHIPKCAGSSIFNYFIDRKTHDVSWKKPNYEVLYGWCPKRKIHLQHATAKQLIETELISEAHWKEYFKFTFVRNPWDRAYSDYLWIQKDTGAKGSFKDFILKQKGFKKVLMDNSEMSYRGDHTILQTDFFDNEGLCQMDFVGRFENLQTDFSRVINELDLEASFSQHEKRNVQRKMHYSEFYTGSKKRLVEEAYKEDITLLGYHFKDRKKGIQKIKKIL